MTVNTKDLAAGLVFIAIGGFFAGNSVLNLRMGSTLNMGPGFFPTILGSILVLLGIAIAARGINKATEPFGQVSWRGLILIMLSIIFFGLTVRGLGIGPSLFITVMLSALSSGRLSWPGSILLSAILTGFSIAVFVYALGLPYPIIGRWLSF